ncbi:hypothetical protein BS636_01540 [Acinetobacter sp. LoGeW2-3]|uniref:DUF3325 domain-containing protein n=1 Tax=Acinetobacter sp. LoGeW2-3 TaxID=1808001 RepID=UPI000C05B564|nr:DUF3325 domain-containing protein [Acinetobacter sp. LoGeW2-3]ATO18445.1 hypothetical protein BS636_01540 [Acinetobacter sp. LoGeW2-3]
MMFFLLIWSITSLGFFALAASMQKHQKQIFGHFLDMSKTRLASIFGWVLLAIALILCILTGALSNMISYWIGSLSFAALLVGLSLSYAETKIKPIVFTCVMVAFITGIIYSI